jgi:hypothetical protein
MTISAKHKFTSPKLDSPDSTKVQPSNWNDEHDLLAAANTVLGRGAGAGDGPVEEIPATATGRAVLGAADAAAARLAIDAAQASAGTTVTTVGAAIHAATAKTTLADNDTLPLTDSAAANVMKKITWANLRLFLKAVAADVYAAVSNKFLTTDMIETASAYVALVNTSTPTINWDEGINREITIAQATQFQTPSNGQPGTYRTVLVKGDGATERAVTFASSFMGETPAITDVTSGIWYDLTIKCITTTHFTVSAKLAKFVP